MVIKLALTGILFVIVINLMKEQKAELSIVIAVAASLILLFFITQYLAEIFVTVTNIIEKTGIDQEIVVLLFRIVGTGYVCEFSSGICEDFGSKAIADKISLAGKVIILVMTLPILSRMVDLILSLLNT